MAFASVYPLVTARSVARPFTYEVPDEVGPGTVVQVRFGSTSRRGVVVDLTDSPPDGVEAAPIEKVVDEFRSTRRAGALDGGLLRLDARAGARPGRADQAGATG